MQFYQLSEEQQSTYLMGCIQVTPVARRRHGTNYDQPCDSRRQASMHYTVPNGSGGRWQVCSKTFTDIFGLSSRRLQTLQEKLKKGETTYKDGRGHTEGSHAHKTKFNDEDLNLTKAHIDSFPREESHYGRRKSSKEYFSPDLNISRMYASFKEKHVDSLVTYKYYSTIFKKYFGKVSFGKPRTDTCELCDKLSMQVKITSDESAKSALQTHHANTERAQDLMKRDFTDSQMPLSETCTVSLDLQQVMFTPTLTHSSMFYSRQLSNYNLGIHADSGKSFMCMWHEGQAGRGGNEVASCVFKVMSSGFTNKKKIVLWCDNCVGQNKNRMMMMALMLLVSEGIFERVEIKFLVSGHSYMPSDRDFGIIEKRKKNVKCMVPDELENMVATARVKNPFKVMKMGEGDFLDLASLANKYLDTSKLKITKASAICFTSEKKGKLLMKTSFDEENWTEFSVFKKGQTFSDLPSLGNVPQLPLSSKISAEKQKDLLAMVPFLDVKYREFYTSLCQ